MTYRDLSPFKKIKAKYIQNINCDYSEREKKYKTTDIH